MRTYPWHKWRHATSWGGKGVTHFCDSSSKGLGKTVILMWQIWNGVRFEWHHLQMVLKLIHTSGAIRKSMRNFWQANPKEVFLSAGLGEGPLLVEQGLYVGVKGLMPLGVPMGDGMEYPPLPHPVSFSSMVLTSLYRSNMLNFRASWRSPAKVVSQWVVPCHWYRFLPT